MSRAHEWNNENGAQWLTLAVVTLGVLVLLLDPTGITRGALFVVFTGLSTLALYGSYMAMTHSNE